MASISPERLSVSITVMVSESTRAWLEEQAKQRWPADIAPVVRDAITHYRDAVERDEHDNNPGSNDA